MSNESQVWLFEVSTSDESDGALRMDKFLVKCLPDLTRTRLQGLIKNGKVSVNDVPVTKTGASLSVGARVRVELPPVQPAELTAQDIPLKIVFENDDVMVVDKPAGMVVHPAAGHDQDTLVNAALGHAPDMEGVSGELRPGLVHRLDKNTSGLIMIAKNDKTLHQLQDQFRLRQVRKVYIALSDGHPQTPVGRIEAAIGRNPSQRKQMAIVSESKGREAVSEYMVIETFTDHTLFEVHPLTGRTHQIRLHLKLIGCPIVGDTVYGHRKQSLALDRHFLHAARLTVTLPGEDQPRTFEAPLPLELQTLLDTLRRDELNAG